MPIISFPSVKGNESIEELRNLVAILIKELEYISNGHIDSANVRNLAGYNVNKTEFKHQSGIVGLSGADPNNAEAVRFWSGDAIPEDAPFQVRQNGKGYFTGASIKSKNGYPRVEISPDSDVISVYYDADTFITVLPDHLPNTPVLKFTDGPLEFYIGYFNGNGTFSITSDNSAEIQIGGMGNVRLNPTNDVIVKNFSSFYDGDSGDDLRTELDNLSARISALEGPPPGP